MNTYIGSVEKGLGQFLFFNRKAELLRVIAQAISDMMDDTARKKNVLIKC
jgi:hypothetical protein